MLRHGHPYDELLYVTSSMHDGGHGSYTVDLPTPCRFVTDAFVLEYHVPRTQRVIDGHNRRMTVYYGDTRSEVLLNTAPCDDADALASRLDTAMDRVHWAVSDGVLVATSSEPFGFEYWPLGRVLGLDRRGSLGQDRVDARGENAEFVIRADHPPDLEPARSVRVRSDALGQHVSTIRQENRPVSLGRLDLTRGYGRLDFVGLRREPFFPIGKLSRLHIRLENDDGTLYETHGQHHTMTIVLRRLVATNAAHDVGPEFQSRLAPWYRPDDPVFDTDSDTDEA